MNRRPLLCALASGGSLLTAGCVGSVPLSAGAPDATDVFDDYRFDGTELRVEFSADAAVEKAVLFDSSTGTEYETIDHPSGIAAFPVIFPNRLESRLSRSLRVKARTPDGWARTSVWEPVHGATRDVTILPDGRARFGVENQGAAPLLVRFVGIYGNVPNPTVDPQSDSFDRSSFDLGPGVVGSGENRPLSPSRTDLVVPPGETAQFETTYAPFAFPHEADVDDCNGTERTGTIAVVHASGGSAAYSFSYRLAGEPTDLQGRTATVCDGEDETS